MKIKNSKRLWFDILSVFLYFVSVFLFAYCIQKDKVGIAFAAVMFQFFLLVFNNRYVPKYRDSVVEGLKILYTILNVRADMDLVCSIFVQNIRGNKIRARYRYSYQGYNLPKSTIKLSTKNVGQGVAGRLYNDNNNQSMFKEDIPTMNDGEEFYNYYSDLGFTHDEAINFREIRSVYCWKLKDSEGDIIGIVCIDSNNNQGIDPRDFKTVSTIYVSILANLLSRQRLTIG